MYETELTRWLASVVALFDSTLKEIMGLPVLRLLLVFLAFLVVVESFAWFSSQDRGLKK